VTEVPWVAVGRRVDIQCGMTGHQKIQQALSMDGTPEIPVVICYEELFIRDHWDQVTRQPWWAPADPDPERQLAWRADAIREIGQDWFQVPSCLPRALREQARIVQRGGAVLVVDSAARTERTLERPRVGGWEPASGCQSVHPTRLPTSFAEIDQEIAEPAASAADAGGGVGDLARSLLGGPAAELFPVRAVSSPLWMCYFLWGFEGMMTTIAQSPDLALHACERFLAVSLAGVEMAAALGARAIWIEECLTDMIGPAAFAALNAPYVRRLIDAIHSHAMAAIYYYCGDPAPVWREILSLPFDALSLEESKKGFRIDIEEVVDRVDGRACVLGNLDAMGLLEHGSEGELKAEIGRQVRAGRRNGSRFIVSTGSPVTPRTPASRVRRYCEIARELGRA